MRLYGVFWCETVSPSFRNLRSSPTTSVNQLDSQYLVENLLLNFELEGVYSIIHCRTSGKLLPDLLSWHAAAICRRFVGPFLPVRYYISHRQIVRCRRRRRRSVADHMRMCLVLIPNRREPTERRSISHGVPDEFSMVPKLV